MMEDNEKPDKTMLSICRFNPIHTNDGKFDGLNTF